MSGILITGGSGSFGNAFVERLLPKQDYSRIVIYSRDEQKQDQMAFKFNNDERLRFFIGDVRDEQRLTMAMHGCDVVVHAAAMKIVPTAEYNPFECVLTNIHGAENVCRAAIATGVKKVLALSTDKAVNPINLYGATKLAAEKIFIAANNLSGGRTNFSVVRYGNVTGSRGSVVPLFIKQRYLNSPLTITDERMTRFWIMMKEAVALVEEALSAMQGREIFIPNIPSVRVVDIAAAILGTGERNWNIIGIRPGEKLHEMLMTTEESLYRIDKGFAYVIYPSGSTSPSLNPMTYTSETNSKFLDADQIRHQLHEAGYV